jgi:acyl-coenzyme A thioesterase PaaI-like protein
MDVTALARSLLDPIPAHRTLGLEVQWAGDSRGEVSLATPPQMANVIGSLHSSGLVALVDAAGLAAIIGACEDASEFEGIVPLGAAASLEFQSPARGRLLATCYLDQQTQKALRPVLAMHMDRARITTGVDIVDEDGAVVCRGTFDWSVRRRH